MYGLSGDETRLKQNIAQWKWKEMLLKAQTLTMMGWGRNASWLDG